MQVVTFAGELLDKATALLQEGLTTTEVADGYQAAAEKVTLLLPDMVVAVVGSAPCSENHRPLRDDSLNRFQ